MAEPVKPSLSVELEDAFSGDGSGSRFQSQETGLEHTLLFTLPQF